MKQNPTIFCLPETLDLKAHKNIKAESEEMKQNAYALKV